MSAAASELSISGLFPWLFFRACSDQPLDPPFTLSGGDIEASPPLLEISLEDDGRDYLVVGRCEDGAGQRQAAFSKQAFVLRDAGGNVLRGKCDKKGFSWWDDLLPSQLQKLRFALLENLPQCLAAMTLEHAVHFTKSLAIKKTGLCRLPDGRWYFQFAHPLFDERAYGLANLAFLGAPGDGVAFDLRFAQGTVHGLSRQPGAAMPAKAAVALLTGENLGMIPLAFSKPRQAPDEALPLAMFAPVASNKTRAAVMRLDGATLQGYALDEAQPYQAISVDAYLDGRYQTRLLADQPGIEFQGKPLSCGWAWELDTAWLDGAAHEIDLLRSDTQQRLAGCPYRLGADAVDASFQLSDGQSLQGRIKARGLREHAPTLAVWLDGEALSLAVDLVPSSTEGVLPVWRVEMPMPPLLNDGAPHRVAVHVMQGARCLSHTVLNYQAHYVGALDRLEPGLVCGWIYLKQAPHKPVNLDVLVNGQVVAQGLARHWPKEPIKITADGDSLPCGFFFRLEPPTLLETRREISLRIAGTQKNVLGPPVLFTPYDIAISALTQAQAVLHNAAADGTIGLANGVVADADATHWVRDQIIAPLIQALRKAKRIPGRVELAFSPSIRLPHPRSSDSVVDIIVPVYRGLQETLSCIRSVLDHTQGGFELIAINDGSPDPALVKMLRAWAGSGAFTLLENPKNLGFVASVNRGMRQHPQRDVVLLNADTQVSAGWLERLRAAALSASNVATATPFSNNATLLSFPKPCRENPMPEASVLSHWAELCAEVNDGVIMEIPTAVGFCMYIRRDALDEVGDFDESRFGRGYAEENDFCLRAAALGWRHVAACDVFVAHHGAKSFQGEKSALIARNLQALQSIYPDYLATIERFTAQDPLKPARNALSKALLKAHSPQYLLFVSHDLGGGVKTHTDDLAQRLLCDGIPVLLLSADALGAWKITAQGLPYVLCYQGAQALANVLADLRELGVWHMHYHQDLFFPPAIWTLPQRLGVTYDVTLHDYHAVCPSINMIDETGQYCGDSQLDCENCNRCLRLAPLDEANPGLGLGSQFQALGSDTAQWRKFYQDKFTTARRVFAPSQSSAGILLRHFALANVVVQPHPEQPLEINPAQPPLRTPDRIAVIGAIGRHKGYSVLLNCAKSALKNGLPLEFIVFGYTENDVALQSLENITLAGAYTAETLPGKLANSGCQLAAFFSVWPETFVYTLSEAWRAGLYPVAFDIGALAERIRGAGYGALIPLSQDAKQINRELIKIAETLHQRKASRFTLGQDYPQVLQNYYGLDKPRTVVAEQASHSVGAAYVLV